MTLTTAPVDLDVHTITDLFRRPQPDGLLISAHRGLRWDGVPENSEQSVRNAGRFGLLSIEVDVRVTSDAHPVVLHDEGFGRVTNIAEYLDRPCDAYNPFTGKGYNPAVKSMPWVGLMENLKLKNEQGRICDTGIMDLERLLSVIEEEKLDILVFLDVKDEDAILPTYNVIKTRHNARGVPALEWCVWKLGTDYYPSPAELEATEWFQDALKIARPLYIPVFEPGTPLEDVMESAKAFADRSYVVAIECGLRGPGGMLQELVDWAKGNQISIGFFAALGDIQPADGREMLFDVSGLDLDEFRAREGSRLCFSDGCGAALYDSKIRSWESPGGRDRRGEIDLYQKMGYSWVIADLSSDSAHIFDKHQQFKWPPSPEWRRRRLQLGPDRT